jgi:hypothetical protein
MSASAMDKSVLNDHFLETEYWPPTVFKLPKAYNPLRNVDEDGEETPVVPLAQAVLVKEKIKIPDEATTANINHTLSSAGWSVIPANWIRRNIGWDRMLRVGANILCGSQTGSNAQADVDVSESSDTLFDDEKVREKILKHNSKAIFGHNHPDSMYFEIRSQNLVSVPTELLARRTGEDDLEVQDIMEAAWYDDNGATLVHQCFQYQRYDMVKWLVRSFPKFALKPYRMNRPDKRPQYFKVLNGIHQGERLEDLPYGGQNLLHMAVLAKNHEFARWLLDFYSKHDDESLFELVTARVVTRGTSYFRKTGNHYYGETPLHFAVCMNDHAMVDLILSFVSLLHTELLATDPDYDNEGKTIRAGRNLLFMPDCNGNSAIHLCVLHNLPGMYDHVKYIALEMIRQELMRVFHNSVSLPASPSKLLPYEPIAINYTYFYGKFVNADENNQGDPNQARILRDQVVVDHPSFKFSGYVRRLKKIDLPSEEVRQLFFDVQAAKLYAEWYRLNKELAADEKGGRLLDQGKLGRLNATRAVLSKLKDAYHDELYQQFSGMDSAMGANGEGSSRLQTPNAIPFAVLSHRKRKSSVVDPLDKRAGGLYDSRRRGKVLSKMFTDFDNYDWDEFFKLRTGELKRGMRQWLYGTDIGLKDGAIHRIFNELFLLGLNEQGHSPATLAAARGKAEILRHLITESVISRDRNYDFDLTAIEVPLIQSESDRKLYAPEVPPTIMLHGAIWWICRNEQNNKLIDSIPEIKAVVVAKWERVGYMIGNRNSQLHFVFLVPLMLLTCLVLDNNSEFSGKHNPLRRQWSTYLLAFCAAIFLGVFFTDLRYAFRGFYEKRLSGPRKECCSAGLSSCYIAPRDIWMSMKRSWTILKNRRPIGAGFFDFSMRIVIAGTFISIIFVRFYRNAILGIHSRSDYANNVYCTLVGACCLCTMIYSFLFLALNENDFGSFLITVTRILLRDFFYFARFWLRIVVMFGLALKTITDDIDDNGFVHAFRLIWALIRLSFNGVPTDEYQPIARQHQFESVWFSFLITLFCLLVNILIINLLIAVMSNTYTAFNGKSALGKRTVLNETQVLCIIVLLCFSDIVVAALSLDGLLHLCTTARRSRNVAIEILSQATLECEQDRQRWPRIQRHRVCPIFPGRQTFRICEQARQRSIQSAKQGHL